MGFLTPIVRLLWSESVDEVVNLEHFPIASVSFHTENPSLLVRCVGWEQESKYKKKVLCSRLVHISVSEKHCYAI